MKNNREVKKGCIVKKFILASFIALTTSSALCMEPQAPTQKSKNTVIPFYIAELRLLITEFLCKELSMGEALKAIKTWSSIDRKAWSFFQSQEVAGTFISWFNKLCYQNDFNRALLNKLTTLLHTEELKNFNHSLQTGAELVHLFENCAAEKEWSPFLVQLPHLQKSTFSKYLAHYYWESSYNDFYAQKTLLVYALELQAPQEVINALIQWGAQLTHLRKKTPPPCLLVCQNSISATQKYDKRCQEDNADRDSLKKDYDAVLKEQKATLALLIEKKASVNDSFATPVDPDILISAMSIPPTFIAARTNIFIPHLTPLFIAAKAGNLELTEYLLSQGASYCQESIFLPLLLEFAQNKIPFSIMEALISKATSHDLQSLFRWTVITALQDDTKQNEDNYCTLIRLFLTKKVAINAREGTLTLLDMVHLYDKCDSKIADLLIHHRALPAHNKKMAYLAVTTEKFLTTTKVWDTTTIPPFLKEIKTTLQSDKDLVPPANLMVTWLGLALKVSSSQEAKEFWKYIALNFPQTPLFIVLVIGTYTMKREMPNQHAYRSLLKNAKSLVSWLSNEGIKDRSTPTAGYTAYHFGIPELASSLASVVPHS